MFFIVEEVDNDEDDISTQKETAGKGSWIQE